MPGFSEFDLVLLAISVAGFGAAGVVASALIRRAGRRARLARSAYPPLRAVAGGRSSDESRLRDRSPERVAAAPADAGRLAG